jgi:hypothetical protein
MWVLEKPSSPVGIVDSKRWGKYVGKYFKRIEISNLLSQQASKADRRQDSSPTVV